MNRNDRIRADFLKNQLIEFSNTIRQLKGIKTDDYM